MPLESPPAECRGTLLTVHRLVCEIDPARIADESATAWALTAARALQSPDPEPIAARREAEAAFLVAEQLATLGSTLRRFRNLDGARQTAEKMLALAEHSVRARPDQPASHLALSFAYAQVYKNACPIENGPAIEANMRRALEAAREALRLDRRSERARHAVDDLERRLSDRRPKG